KRVSMKGRGADIFFGDYEPPAPPAAPAPEEAAGRSGDAATEARTPPPEPAGGDTNDEPVDAGALALPAPQSAEAGPSAPDTAPAGEPEPQDNGAMVVQPSMHATKQASGSGSPEPESLWSAPLDPAVLDATWQNVARQATLANTFRYTDQELTWLNDALYELTKRHRVKLTKQDIVRLGLNAVLRDYQVHGDASLLGEFVRRKRRP
ncbi:MAG: hypothetical protein M3Q65_08695, partial [Chloroflexota bacterium]|nr:hypothetical protein [Chloroflexota bacterium]